jgi:hypothetical protein
LGRSSRGDRSEILIEPPEDISNQFVERGNVAAVMYREAFAIGRSAEQSEQGLGW